MDGDGHHDLPDALDHYSTFWLMGYKLKHTLMALAPAMLLHAAVCGIHPNMHSLPDIPIGEGVPSQMDGLGAIHKFFKFLYVNHEVPIRVELEASVTPSSRTASRRWRPRDCPPWRGRGRPRHRNDAIPATASRRWRGNGPAVDRLPLHSL